MQIARILTALFNLVQKHFLNFADEAKMLVSWDGASRLGGQGC